MPMPQSRTRMTTSPPLTAALKSMSPSADENL
jgi:hypothetical protein